MGLSYEVGDIVTLKKVHPCGSRDWEILRVGADLMTVCLNGTLFLRPADDAGFEHGVAHFGEQRQNVKSQVSNNPFMGRMRTL